MEPDLKDILGKASGPGDIATILIAGSLAYVLDAGADFLPFMEPGAVSIIMASGVLGFKKAIEAAQEHRLRARVPGDLTKRVLSLIQLFEEVGREDLVERLRREKLLLQADVGNPGDVASAIDEIVRHYRQGAE